MLTSMQDLTLPKHNMNSRDSGLWIRCAGSIYDDV